MDSPNKNLSVAVPGLFGCFAQSAAAHFFGPNSTYIEAKNFEGVFKAVESGEAKRGIVPIETSDYGSLFAVYDLLVQHTCSVVGEVHVHDTLCLIGKKGSDYHAAQKIWSHPQIFQEATKFVSDITSCQTGMLAYVHTPDTAQAVKRLSEDPVEAEIGVAIGNKAAAEMYGLEVLAEGIEDNPKNVTRYIVLSASPILPHPYVSSRTMLACVLTNAPGAMFKALSCFALRDMNILKLETRPSSRTVSMHGADRPWDYLMYVDINCNLSEKKATRALESLEDFAQNIRVLGCFPRFAQPSGNDLLQAIVETTSLTVG